VATREGVREKVRKRAISEMTYCRKKANRGFEEVSKAIRLTAIEVETSRIRKLVADLPA